MVPLMPEEKAPSMRLCESHMHAENRIRVEPAWRDALVLGSGVGAPPGVRGQRWRLVALGADSERHELNWG